MGPAHPYNCWRKPVVIERELIQVVWGGGASTRERELPDMQMVGGHARRFCVMLVAVTVEETRRRKRGNVDGKNNNKT